MYLHVFSYGIQCYDCMFCNDPFDEEGKATANCYGSCRKFKAASGGQLHGRKIALIKGHPENYKLSWRTTKPTRPVQQAKTQISLYIHLV